MKIRKNIISTVAILTLISCSKFEEINTDKFGITPKMGKTDGIAIGSKITAMQTRVTPVGTQADGTDIVNKYQIAYHLAADTWSGYFAQNQDWNGGTNNTTYFLIEGWNKASYASSYTEMLPLWSAVKEEAQKSDFPEAFALAQILKISAWHKTTDMFGPIPYKQAGEALFVVPYDSQQDVYQYFFDDLTEAINVLTNKAEQGTKLFAQYDAVYAGDVKQWVKYANSLMLRLAMRIRYADAVKAQKYAEQAVNHPIGVIILKTDEAKMAKGAGSVFINNIETCANQYAETRMGSSMFSYLVGYQDPRLPAYFKPSTSPYAQEVDFTGEKYQAIPTGYGNKSESWKLFSIPNIEKETPTYWLRASEVCFLRAEGALLGWNMGGNAEDFYRQGVQMSFEENQITSDVDSYLNSGKQPAKYDSNSRRWGSNDAPTTATARWEGSNEEKLEKIITQKWIALYPNGQEAWSEYRRTGYPKLHPVRQNRSTGEISSQEGVRRMKYPESGLSAEQRANLNKALELLGGPNTGGTKVWWDKK
ncbi:RagB/SusD family nutrient uptake outer membrane protein [Capnocytophaga sp.]|uniref:RagB/SusD family nutrient uptake outer membrane protein n=1 Tax=Capnocytophaga sp. TaxID=44737 RepID=UPI0026DD341A|nr:RagB/SusD family nutrient uptake outer membrane protein [Capnocytophaga sp.]MDO5104347.1 RagB/SusD family nutrient uptake outer membrane protein [Capnocytophaga sp.]